MNRYNAIKILNINSDSSWEEIKIAYRKLALEFHPDKNTSEKDGNKFKRITDAYNFLKTDFNQNTEDFGEKFTQTDKKKDVIKKPQWGAPPDGKIPEEDWSKYTRELEEEDPAFWKEYEKRFWEDYNARIRSDGKNGEYEKAKEPEKQPNLFVYVDKSLCIGCCSCEMIAPNVFSVNKNSKTNPKS